VDQSRVERAVEVRTRRQDALRREQPVHLWVVMDEAAIHRAVGGPDVMREQREHLLRMAESPSVTLQVVPFRSGAHPGMAGAFVLVEFPHDDPPLVYTDSAGGGIFLETEDDVERYRSAFDHLVTQALSPPETVDLITRTRS